jgi:hypothetical protein
MGARIIGVTTEREPVKCYGWSKAVHSFRRGLFGRKRPKEVFVYVDEKKIIHPFNSNLLINMNIKL